MSEKESMTGLARLLAHLATVQPGELAETTDLERLLAASWDEFTGDDGGMAGYKLLGRIEDVTWQPPKLTFTIERHGGTPQKLSSFSAFCPNPLADKQKQLFS